jgi:YVTN family beta-propeller protein
MIRKKFGRPAVAVAAALTVIAAGSTVAAAEGFFGSTPFGDKTVGAQADGSHLMHTNQFVTPVGEVITENGRPFGLALNPDGRTAASLNNGGATTGMVSVFDLVNHKLLQQTGTGGKANGGVLYTPDGKALWVAQPGGLARFDVAADGMLSNQLVVKLPGVSGREPVPAGLGWAANGTDLLVTLSANNTLGVVDTTTNTLVRQVAVGNVPNSVVVVDGKAYVSNQGGRPAQPGEQTDNSYGTPIVTQNNSAVPSTGTVSEVDLASGAQVRTFAVGLQPSAMLAVGKTVVVANSDDDSVSSIDTVKQQVGRSFIANPAPGAPFGASPNGLAMLDATHLAVSLGRDNAVAIYSYRDAYTEPSFEGLIPAGSFPSGLAQDAQLHRLVIASEQGVGSVGANGTLSEGLGTNPATSHLGYNFVGTVQTVATPTAKQMATWTQQVFKNNQWIGLQARNQQGNSHAHPVAVPLHTGDPSTIKHVFLIVKENRTYDQVLGDDPRGNGDPSLAQFGGKITPNTHALATQFPLIDNLYSDGTNSAEGHHWLDQAFVNNYMQQMYGSYTRSYQTGDPMSNAKSGWIWDDALAHGKTVTNWGEQIDSYVDANGKGTAANSWTKWLHDSQVLDGTAPGPLAYPLGTYHAKTDIPSLAQITKPNFPNFDLNIPDQYRAAMFQKDFAGYEKNNNLPALNLMWVMNDHTSGTSPGGISPEAHVADNDLALGRIVDTISHSKDAKDSAIFVLEDDSQNGVDHVDGHRTPTLVLGPYAKRGAVVHTYYTQLNVMRTIEQILGLPPMNQEDMTAEPMYDVFTNKPNFTPYTYLPNQVSLTETNPAVTVTTNALQTAWAQWSVKQDWSSEDMMNMEQGNRDVWYSSSNFTKPYQGDTKVLMPNQVPGANVAPASSPAGGAR